MPELYIISFSWYIPEVFVSNVIYDYQIVQIYHISVYSQYYPNPHQEICSANNTIPFCVISMVSCGRDMTLLYKVENAPQSVQIIIILINVNK